MSSAPFVITAETVTDLLDVPLESAGAIIESGVDVTHAYTVLNALKEETSYQFSSSVESTYVRPSISKGAFGDVIRTIDLLILPFAHELDAAGYRVVEDALTGLLRRSQLWHDYRSSFFEGWMKLSTDPVLIHSAITELRAIAAVHRSGVPMNIQRSVISNNNSPRCSILSMNTPLDLLLRDRPDRLDDIIHLIVSEKEVDGDRIAAMLDSDAVALSSGVL